MKERNFQQIKEELPGIKRNVSLKSYTTFKIGGPAKYFFEAKGKEDLIEAILVAESKKLPFFILGGGSNILVSDKGYKGLIIKIKNQKSKIKNTNQKSKIIETESDALLSQIVALALKNSLTGLEWAIGIPGTIGGAIYGNAGAFGRSTKDVIQKVEVFDLKDKKIKILKNKDCKFGYRDSIFKHANSARSPLARGMQTRPCEYPNLIILSATLQLKKRNKKKIQEKMKEYLNYRKEKQPLNLPSAGSIFKNQKPKPEHKTKSFVLGRAHKYGLWIKNQKLLKEFSEIKEFNKKGQIPAAWLIEECGLKGKKVGNVKISEKHANFIVNLGGGKAKDVKKLINLAKKKVKEKFGITLEEEICYLGFKN